MSTVFKLEKEILALSSAEREQLAALAWDSVVGDPSAAGDPGLDREGIEIAGQRDTEIESGAVQPIGHAEFLRRTGGDPE